MIMSNIYDFLQSHRSGQNEPYTHTGLNPMIGKYYIPENHLDTFYKLYNKSLRKNEILSITEIHDKIGPILIDIDLRFNEDIGINRKYSENDIKTLLRIYNEQISHYFDCDEDSFKSYIFEKPEPVRNKGNIKDGIHIIYPYIISSPEVQYEIRENVIRLLKETRCISLIGFKNELEDVIDKAVISKNPWLMYGSSKPDQKPYIITHIYNKELEDLDLPTKTELPRLLSIRNHTNETKLKVKPTITLKKQVLSSKTLTKDAENAIQLVNILSPHRADNYNEWLELGFCLHNIDINLLDVWITFSKVSPKFEEGGCEKLWKNFKNEGLTIASLHRWAKIDNPTKYSEIKSSEISTLLYDSLSGTNYDVANVVHAMYKHSFVCASVKYGKWYVFKNHRWNETDRGFLLRQKFSTELVVEYRKLANFYKDKRTNCKEDEDKELKSKFDKCNKLIELVKSTSFKDKVLQECIELFYDSSFLNKLDSNVNLIAFENGVYDLHRKIFRDGLPDDYISFSTKVDYTPFDHTDENSIELSRFIEKVMPLPDVRKYILTLLASFLNGKNDQQKFHIWTGSGGNGKSTLIELFEKSFGEYCGKLPITVLTQKRSGSSAASPEIARTKGKRFISLQEPEQNDQIHVGYMKELTGGDIIMARALYSEPVEFKPQFHIILACNELPTIPSTDGGTWRRLRVVDFPSKFVDNPVNKNEFKKDSNLQEKMIIWKSVFISLLIEIYNDYSENGITEPDIVKKFTKEYQKSSDNIMEYLDDHIEITKNQNDSILLTTIMNDFREWYRTMYNEKAPTRKILKPYLTKYFGVEMGKSGWKGAKLKVKKNDDEDDVL